MSRYSFAKVHETIEEEFMGRIRKAQPNVNLISSVCSQGEHSP